MKILQDVANYDNDTGYYYKDDDGCSLFLKESRNITLGDNEDDDGCDFCEDGSEYGPDPYDFRTYDNLQLL